MKILHLSKYYPPYQGGIETFLFDLNNALNKKGSVQSDILCFNDVNNTIEETFTLGYLVHRSSKLFEIARMPVSINYLTWLRKNCNNYDIIHVHYPNPLADLAVFLSGFKGHIIIHWHSDIVKQKKLEILYRRLRKWLLKRSSKIIATSPEYANGSAILKSIKDKKVVIPLGLDENRIGNFDPLKVEAIKSLYGYKKIVFSLGRQVYYKGFKYLIEGAKHLDDDSVVLIGGKGDLYEKHKRLISQLALENKVKMIGFISNEELPNYFEACNAYVMSSIHASEAFGVVQLEAMSFSKPVVSTNIVGSGVGWVNKNGDSGIVVEPMDSKALAKAINTLLRIPNNDVGKRARTRFENFFTIEKISNDILSLYKNVASDK